MPCRASYQPLKSVTEVGHKWQVLDTLVWDLWNADIEGDRLAASAVKETSRGIPQPPRLPKHLDDTGSFNSDSQTCSPAWQDAFKIVQPQRRPSVQATSRQRPASAAARFVSTPQHSACSTALRPHSASSNRRRPQSAGCVDCGRRRPQSAGTIGSTRKVQSVGRECKIGKADFLCRDSAICDFWAQQQLEQQEMARFRQDVIKQIGAENRLKAQQYRARVLFASTSLEEDSSDYPEMEFVECTELAPKKRLQCLSATVPASARMKMLDRLRAKHQATHIDDLFASSANQPHVEAVITT